MDYKYYKSDFRLLIDIDTKYKGEDDSIVALTTKDEFTFRFYTSKNTEVYICSSTGGDEPVLKNCTILDDHKVMCHFDRSQLELAPGTLMLEAEFRVPDRDFEGDEVNNIKRLYTTSLILTTEPDKDSEGDHTYIPLLIDCWRGEAGTTAYQYAQEQGYEGTEEEFAQDMKIVPEVAQEANNRIDNFEGALTGSSPIYEFSEETEYGTGVSQVHYCYRNKLLYAALATHIGAWNSRDFEQVSIIETVVPVFENVVIELKMSDDTAVAGVNVTVDVEGESEVRTITTNAEGKCSTSVLRGLTYTITFPHIEGYFDLEDVQRQAMIAQRTIVETYRSVLNPDVESVTVEAAYSTEGNKASSLTVVYGGVDHVVTIDSGTNIATFNVPEGLRYTIEMPYVEGYRTPADVSFVAEGSNSRSIKRLYHPYIESGIFWKMKDGGIKELGDITREDYDNDRIFGLVFDTQGLQGGNSFIILFRYLIGNNITGCWLNSQADIGTLRPFITTDGAGVSNFTGEENCRIIREYCNTTGRQSDVAQSTYNLVFQVDGIERHCFTPSYGQLKIFTSNRDTINSIFNTKTGRSIISLSNTSFWVSNQSSSSNGTQIRNNNIFNYTKTDTGARILPVCAYL